MKVETATPESIAKFKAILSVLNMSQRQIAAKIGWKQSRLNGVINGKVATTPIELWKVCVDLGLDPHAIDERFASTKQRSGFKPGCGPKKKTEIVGDSV